MKIAPRVREVLEDGNPYTIGELWQLVNGAKIDKKLMSISAQGSRLRKIAGEDFIGHDALERSVRGLVYRGGIKRLAHHPSIFAGEKKYICATPIYYYQKW
jgi:hypothetical protein